MKKLLLPSLLASLLTAASPALAQHTHIAAVVNDNVITTIDLEQRLRLAILSAGLPDNAEVRAHLLPQILHSLIDEQLQVQEAKKLDISVSKEEIDQTLEHIAQDNHIQGSMLDFIAAHGASPDALTAQIRNSLMWNKVVQRELRSKVEVGDDEIEAVIDRIRADSGKDEFLVSEIVLPVDNPKDEDQIKQSADKLVAEIKHGANFGAVARQFSQGPSAAQGGDIGWVQPGQLSPEISKVLVKAGAGQVSDPIRTSNGFHILGVREKRTITLGDPSKATINLIQAFRPYVNNDKDAALADASKLRAAVKSCATIDTAIASFPNWKVQKLGNMSPAKAPQWLSAQVQNIAVGSSSEPLATDKGAAVLFVCGRTDGGDIDRDALYHSLGTEKLQLQARRLMRDLQRSAYIDIKLGKES